MLPLSQWCPVGGKRSARRSSILVLLLFVVLMWAGGCGRKTVQPVSEETEPRAEQAQETAEVQRTKPGEEESQIQGPGEGDGQTSDERPDVPRLVADLTSPNAGVRQRAAERLRRLQDRSAVPALIRRVADNLLDQDGEKDAALFALMALAPDRVAEAMGPALESDNPRVRAWAVQRSQPKAEEPERSVAGTWDSNWGPVTLRQGGPAGGKAFAISGFWVPEPGKRGDIREGTFDPTTGVLQFTFRQPGDGKTGLARLTLTDEQTFEGTWKCPGDNGTLTLQKEAWFAQGSQVAALESSWAGGREQVNLIRLRGTRLEATTATPREVVGLRALTDGDPATVTVAAAGSDVPLDVVYGFGGATVTPEKLLVRLPRRAPPGAATGSVEVLVSTLSPHAGFRTLRTLPLKSGDRTQELTLPPAGGRWMLLRFRPAEGAPRVAVAEVTVLGRNGAPSTPYAFKEAPARAIDLLARLRKVSALNVSVSADEAALFADVQQGRFRTWSFAEAALLASGVHDRDKRKAYLEQLDRLADQARQFVGSEGTAPVKGERLLQLLHGAVFAGGYVANQTDLTGILDDHTYNCVSSAVLYNILALRLGLDARGIEVPDHAFSILYDGAAHADVETTTPDGFDPAREPGARRHFTRRTGFVWIPESHPEKRREMHEAGLVALIYYNHGVELAHRKRYHEALLAFFRAMSLDSELASAVKNALAVLANWSAELGREGKYEEALEVLDTGLGLAPADATLRHNRTAVWTQWAQALIRSGKDDEAVTVLHKAEAAVPAEVAHFQALRAWAYIRRGEELARAEKWEQAVAQVPAGLNKLTGKPREELQSWTVSVYLRWSQAELRRGEHEAAANVLQRGLEAVPKDKRLAGYLGQVVREWMADTAAHDGEQKADRLLEQQLARYRQTPEVRQAAAGYVLVGAVRLIDEKKYAEALDYLDRRADWLPERGREIAEAVYDLWAEQPYTKKDWAGAADVYAQALKRYPKNKHLVNNALATYDSWAKPLLDAGDWPAAREVYARALEKMPDSPHVQHNLGYIILRLVKETSDKKGTEEGKKQLAQLQERFKLKDLGTTFVFRSLAEMDKAGNYEEAVAFLDRSADLIPDKDKVRRLSLALFATWAKKREEAKDPAGAAAVYAQAARRWPDEADIRLGFVKAAQSAVKAGESRALEQCCPDLAATLAAYLTDKAGKVRGPAADTLRLLGDASAVPALRRRVADDLWYVSGYSNVPDDPEGGGKAAALEALRKLAADQVEAALLEAARAKTVEVRTWALARLADLQGRGDDPAVVSALVGGLSEPDLKDKRQAARMVRKGGHIRAVAAEGLRKLEAKSAVPALKKRVADDVWYRSGYSNVPSDPEAGGKDAALKALRELAPDEVAAALEQAAQSKTVQVREWAAKERKTPEGMK